MLEEREGEGEEGLTNESQFTMRVCDIRTPIEAISDMKSPFLLIPSPLTLFFVLSSVQ